MSSGRRRAILWRVLCFSYATCLMIILATEIAAAIYAAMHSHMFEKDFREILRASLRMYNGTDARTRRNDNTVLVKAAWDKIMIEKNCCGVDSKVGEFNESGWYMLTGKRHPFPPACCPTHGNSKLVQFCKAKERYAHGCYDKIMESFQELSSHFKIVTWVIVLVALIQGCLPHLYYHNRLHFSSVFGMLAVLVVLQIIGSSLAFVYFRRIKRDMLYFY